MTPSWWVPQIVTNGSTSQIPKTFQPKNKGLIAKTFDHDEEEVLDDEEITEVKVLMALADDELIVGKNHARNGEWIDITMRKGASPSSKNVSATVTVSETEQITPSVTTKLVQMLIDEKILKAKAKPFPPCTHCGFNNHRPDDCKNYTECDIYGSYNHFTLGHNHVIHIRGGVLAESSQSS
ncbi:hypothetical protein Tco_0877621 [Tanacetum coccineum]|uniref:Retrovirus-related Pol polyprotein from transposon TNT 1-94 n=1 Tax=Tanacetum coccineum TaxID=301880 RepID=A0ABQ5BVK6_9ASTR